MAHAAQRFCLALIYVKALAVGVFSVSGLAR